MNGGNIDQGTTTLKISTPTTLTSVSIAVDEGVDATIAGIVQETNRMRLTFSSPVPMMQNCNVRVVFPSQF